MTLYQFREKFTEVKATTFGAFGFEERKHLQAALRDNIEVISDDLMVISEEFGQWEGSLRRIDLLCLDSDGHLVVLELKRTDDGGHSDLQAMRYAAMVSILSLDDVIDAHQRYLAKRGIEGEAGTIIRRFLEGQATGDVALLDNVRIILVAAGFSKEITTTVLWLASRGLDITCIQMRPHQMGGECLVDVQQLLPLPGAKDYQVAQRRKVEALEQASGKDYTKYDVTTSAGRLPGLPKRRLLLELVREAMRQGVSPDSLLEAVPWRKTWTFCSARGKLTSEQLFEAHPTKNPRRWFSADDELFHVGNHTYALSNQWGHQSTTAANNIIALLNPRSASYTEHE